MKSQRIKIFIKISFLLSIFLFSCGIPKVIYLEPPKAIHTPNGSSDFSQSYFEFETTDVENKNDPYTGFKIFYRIYESESECKKAISSVDKANESNQDYLIEKLSLNLLSYEGSTLLQIIPSVSSATANRRVQFRCIKYGAELPELKINGGAVLGLLSRSVGKSFSNISIDDVDVKKASSNPVDNPVEYFVPCFVVTYGITDSYEPIYSKIVSLGYIKIQL